jgi:hypothetical protein
MTFKSLSDLLGQIKSNYVIGNPTELFRIFPKFNPKSMQGQGAFGVFYTSKSDDPDRKCNHRLLIRRDIIVQDGERTSIAASTAYILNCVHNKKGGLDLHVIPVQTVNKGSIVRTLEVRFYEDRTFAIMGKCETGCTIVIAALSLTEILNLHETL